MATNATASCQSLFTSIPPAVADPIFALTARYAADAHPSRINVGVGAYRTDDGKPWVLPVVQKAKQRLINDPDANHEYLPITGFAPFVEASRGLVLGEAVPRENVASVQAISGTGSLRLVGEFCRNFRLATDIHLPRPTWANHNHIFTSAGLTTHLYPYWDPLTKSLAFQPLIQHLQQLTPNTLVLLHPCAHNPTGVDPTPEQWREIAGVVKERRLVAVFDIAYQGFASGDLERDAEPIRMFARQGLEFFVTQSFAKNFGLYGQIGRISRGILSNCPSFGARIVAMVLTDRTLYAEWCECLKVMSGRILEMRKAVCEGLQRLGTPGNWEHVARQIGMFSFTGLAPNQCDVLTDKFHIYLTRNGRISLAGLNTSNLEHFVTSVDWVVRNVEPLEG